jgi:hypothetical protein
MTEVLVKGLILVKKNKGHWGFDWLENGEIEVLNIEREATTWI